MTRPTRIAPLVLILLSAWGLPDDASAQTRAEQTVETRLSVAVLVPAAELQRWLPEPWVVRQPAGGPADRGMLTMIFVDRMLTLDADGAVAAGGIDRGLVLSAAARNTRTGDEGSYVIRGFTSNPAVLPGAYRNYRLVEVRREQTLAAAGVEPGEGTDRWRIDDPEGGRIELEVEYERGVPVRSKPDATVRGGPDPDFYRIYRLDQGTDVVLNPAAGVDRVDDFELSVSIPELAHLFDGSEEVVSVTVTPWYVRDVYLP